MQNLKYGTETIPFDFPDHGEVFHIDEPEISITPIKFAHRIKTFLALLNPDLKNVAIVLGDKTRVCGYQRYLPVLLETLEHFGASPDHITIFIAYGTHARQSEEESRAIYGNSYKKYRFIHHECTDEKIFIHRGKTSRGTQIMIRKDIAETSFLITFGAISHHYFAGYGGGRKLIFPGLGFQEAIYHNHSLFLDKENRVLAPCCQPGILEKNPLAEDLMEIEHRRPADMSIHGILNSRGEICDLLTGKGVAHFKRACAEHGRYFEISGNRVYDLVIASCGGYPKDINFIQAHKALHNAAKFIKTGGTLILLARCREGIGSKTFLPWFEKESRERAFNRLAVHYKGNGGTALSMMSKTERIRICMVTELEDNITKTMGVERISADKAEAMAQSCPGSLAVIPNAGLLVKMGLLF